MKIYSQAPTRIGLIGGGTDVDPFASKYGGSIVNIAINLFHRVTLAPREDKQIFIENLKEIRQLSLDKNFPEYGQDKNFDLVYAIINHFKPKIKTGFNLYDRFDGSHSAGLGSSGSAAVAIIGAFNQWLNLKMSTKEIALLAWKMETEELGWVSGKQDQIAAAYGGINYLTFNSQNKFSVKPIKLNQLTIESLRQWLVLTYTGGTRHSAHLQKELKSGMSDQQKILALKEIKSATILFYKTLLKQQWLQMGKILNKAWLNKKKSNPSATNDRIDYLYDLAVNHGAVGGKIMGAGGEGHMFFFCEPQKQEELKMAFKAEGLELIDFQIDFKGLQVSQIKTSQTYHNLYIRHGFKPKRNWAVFLDRDGVINKEIHLLHKIRDFEFIPNTAKAIKYLNNLNIPVIVFHNASVVARGLCNEAQVQAVHQHMIKELELQGAYVDAIFYCPHHPTAFNPDYIAQCDWRKPHIGMLTEAAKIFDLNLSKSYVVGDSGRDILVGLKAKCYSVLVKTGHAGKDSLYPAKADEVVNDLLAAVKTIITRSRIK